VFFKVISLETRGSAKACQGFHEILIEAWAFLYVVGIFIDLFLQ